MEVQALVDGIPETKTLPPGIDVRHAIEELLPPYEKPRAGEYQLSSGGETLSPDSLLKDKMAAGTILVLTKKDGGGGRRWAAGS